MKLQIDSDDGVWLVQFYQGSNTITFGSPINFLDGCICPNTCPTQEQKSAQEKKIEEAKAELAENVDAFLLRPITRSFELSFTPPALKLNSTILFSFLAASTLDLVLMLGVLGFEFCLLTVA